MLEIDVVTDLIELAFRSVSMAFDSFFFFPTPFFFFIF